MCVVSMVMDHYRDKWEPRVPIPYVIPPFDMPGGYSPPPVPRITQEEIDEFRRLLERAREYDKKNNQPDCELDAKKQKVKKLAEKLGVKIDFL